MIWNVYVGTLLPLVLLHCFSGPLRAVAEDVEMLQISAGCGGPENQMQCLAFSGISHEQFSIGPSPGFGC